MSVDMTALGWKAIAKFAAEQADAARVAHGPGAVIQAAGTVRVFVGDGAGTITEDSTVSGRVAWKSLALLLMEKVNAETLDKVARDYNNGHRPKEPLSFHATASVSGLESKPTVRRGSIRSADLPVVATVADVAVLSA